MLSNIQILRAFAAMSVVLYHVIGTSASYLQPVSTLSILQGWGQSGVDLFFVISGFVIYQGQCKAPKNARSFARNRLLRLVPIYWILTLTVVLLHTILPNLSRSGKPSFEHTIWSLLFMSNLMLDTMPALYVGWSLEYEMAFYGLFFASLLITKGKPALLLPSVLLCTLYFIGLTDTLVLNFCLGMICAHLTKYSIPPSWAFLSLIIGLATYFSTIFHNHSISRFLLWGIPSFFILLGASSLPQFRSKQIEYIGSASYSIYLIQVFSIPAFYKFSSNFLRDIDHDTLAISTLLITTACGCMMYRLVEQPLGNFLKNRLNIYQPSSK